MKVLACISNFGDSQLIYLHQLLIAYDNMEAFDVDVVLHTTVRLDLSRYSFEAAQDVCKESVGRDLALRHRELMIDLQDRYDLFIYGENDVLITEANLLAFCEAAETLPSPYVPGFVRYERSRRRAGDTELYLPDAHPSFGRILKEQLTINERRCARLRNAHQGCFVLTRDQLKLAMQSPFFRYHNPGDRLNLEVAASFVYIGCGLQKVIPIDLLDQLLVHHLSDKYVNLNDPPWNETPPYTLKDLKSLLAGGALSSEQVPSN